MQIIGVNCFTQENSCILWSSLTISDTQPGFEIVNLLLIQGLKKKDLDTDDRTSFV